MRKLLIRVILTAQSLDLIRVRSRVRDKNVFVNRFSTNGMDIQKNDLATYVVSAEKNDSGQEKKTRSFLRTCILCKSYDLIEETVRR